MLVYLQYQGLITVNMEKIQHFTETATSSIDNFANAVLHHRSTFGNNQFDLPDLATPFEGSMTIGVIAGFLRG